MELAELRAALAGTDDDRTLRLVAEADAAAIEIVRRHLDDHAVTHAGPNAELAHLSRRVGEHHVLIVEFHAEVPIGQDLSHHPVELQHIFFSHLSFALDPRRACATWPDLHAQGALAYPSMRKLRAPAPFHR